MLGLLLSVWWLLAAGTLLFTQAILFHWVETKRGMDLKNPGSQGDGSFFGITDDFKGKENAYPGEQRQQRPMVARKEQLAWSLGM